MAAKVTQEVKGRFIDAAIAEREAYTVFADAYVELIKEHGINKPLDYSQLKKIEEEYAKAAAEARSDLAKLKEQYPGYNVTKDPDYKKASDEINSDIKDWEGHMNYSSLVLSANAEKFGNKSDQENTSINDTTKKQDNLYQELLGKNSGLAVGDQHNQGESLQLISRNMKDAKKQGLDTVYIEMEASSFEVLRNCTDKQLQEFYDKGKTVIDGKTLNLDSAKDTAKHYEQSHSDNWSKEMVGMAIAARKEGVRLVNIDARLSNNPIENEDDARIAKTNLEWPQAIADDRKANDLHGKYIVFAGVAHFADTDHKGLVDERLGIPSIAFDHSRKETDSYRKAKPEEGIDYWMDGGPDYSHASQDFAKYRKETEQALKEQGFDPKTLQQTGEAKGR